MKRITARGRILPQSISTDRRIGRLSLKAALLFPMMWVNCDDQGRLSGDPDEIKYAVCPNIDHITKADIPKLLKELETQELIKVYSTSKSAAIQMLDWWDVEKLQWAWPSQYPPPQGWQDRLRYKEGKTKVVTENWDSPESSGENTGEPSPEKSAISPLTTPSENEEEEVRGRGRRRGRGSSPESSGEKSTASSATLLNELKHWHEQGWDRNCNAKESAQLRDLAEELAAAHCPVDYIKQAFREAAVMNKLSIRYVRKILLAWSGTARSPP